MRSDIVEVNDHEQVLDMLGEQFASLVGTESAADHFDDPIGLVSSGRWPYSLCR